MAAHAAVLVMDLHLPACRSLKDRRAVLRPVIEGARHRFSVAVSETGSTDRWQRAEVAFATVGSAPSRVVDALDAVERFVWSFPELEVLTATRHWVEVDGAG